MRDRIEVLLLFATLLVVAGFVGSFVAGLRESAEPTEADAPLAEEDYGAPSALGPHPARVEVMNAAGRSGMARRATASLRDQGFDVVYFGNAPTFDRDSSVVIDRTGDSAAARAVARALGIRRLESLPDPGLYLDATVLLGSDWPPPDTRRRPGVTDRLAQWWTRAKEVVRSPF